MGASGDLSKLAKDPDWASRLHRTRRPHVRARQKPSQHHHVVHRQRIRLRPQHDAMHQKLHELDSTRPVHYEAATVPPPPTSTAGCTPTSPSFMTKAAAPIKPQALLPLRICPAMGTGPAACRIIGHHRSPSPPHRRMRLGMGRPRHPPQDRRWNRVLRLRGDYGDKPNDGNFCIDGPLLARSHAPHRSHRIQARHPARARYACEHADRHRPPRNRYGFHSLSHLACAWKVVSDGQVVQEGTLPHPEIKAGDSAELKIPYRVPASVQSAS